MFDAGLDLHATHITACVLDANGKVHKRFELKDIDQVIARLKQLPKFEVCFEASTGYGRYYETFKKIASRVVVAHPGLLRLIFRSKRKNDRADAQKLAKLLYVGEVPEVHVPKADVRAWRETITFRKKLISKRTQTKNGLRCLLRTLGIKPPTEFGLWTKRGLAWLKSLTFEQPLHSVRREMLLDELADHERHIQTLEQGLEKFSVNNPAIDLLRTIPGVGLRTAEAVVAFIDDPHRFADGKKLGAYFGLVPSQDQSGRSNKLGHITKEGSPVVRTMLTEAVWQAVRRSPTVRAYCDRISRGEQDRKKIAVIATAHYLVRTMWAMLKRGTVWRERPELVAAA